MRTDEYLKIVTEQVRSQQARAMIEKEMTVHMEEQKAAYISDGMSEGEAEFEAVRDMGDPVETGNQMDLIHRPRMAWGMIALIVFLSAAGFVIQYLMKVNLQPDGNAFMAGQLVFLLMGLAVMIGICYIDYSQIGLWARGLTIALGIAIFLGIMFSGAEVNGARMWIVIGRFSVNINMIAYLFVPLYGAILYRYRGQGYRAIAKAVLWMLPVLLLSRVGLSLWTVIIICLTFGIILSAAIVRSWYKVAKKVTLAVLWAGAVLVPAAFATAVMAVGKEYQAERLRSILSYGNYGNSYLVKHVWGILSGSQLVGMNQNVSQMTNLPMAFEDYTLLYVIAYYGVLAASLIIGISVILFGCLLSKSMKQKNQMGMIMGLGCCTAFFTQTLFYALGNTGFLPAGAFCPFITYGGSGMLVTYALLGILLSIYRHQNIIPEPSCRNKGISRIVH